MIQERWSCCIKIARRFLNNFIRKSRPITQNGLKTILMNIFQILTDSSKLFPQKPAIIFKDKTVSFEELKTNVLALAGV